jgi:ribose transport system permease protein
MTDIAKDSPQIMSRGLRFPWARHQGVMTAVVVLVGLLAINNLMSRGGMSYFEFSFLSLGGATLAIAAAGQTLVILTGGFVL